MTRAGAQPDPPFAGLILAGGEGRRWGGPKAWARLDDGTTFLERCASVLATSGAHPVLATLPPATTRTLPGLHTVHLEHNGLDMYRSFLAGMEHLLTLDTWHAVVVLPVDHPLVTPPTIAALVAAGPPAAIPTLAGRHGHPICLWRTALHPLPTSPTTTLRHLLHHCNAHDVPVNDPAIRLNLNHPHDLDRS